MDVPKHTLTLLTQLTGDPIGRVLAVLCRDDEISPDVVERLWERLGRTELRGSVPLLEAGLAITQRVLAAWRGAGAE